MFPVTIAVSIRIACAVIVAIGCGIVIAVIFVVEQTYHVGQLNRSIYVILNPSMYAPDS